MKKENFEEFDENEHDNEEHKPDEEPKRNGKGRKGRKKKKEQTDTDKLPLATMEQLRQALSMMIVSRLNGITMKPEVRWLGDSLDPFSQSTIVTDGDGEYGNEWHDLNDREVNTLYQCCSHYYRCNIKDIEAIINSHFTHLTDPICDWLDHNSLANFFDTDHDYIKDVADHVHIRPTGGQTQQEAQQEWTECFRRWLVGMVRGILMRGVTNQTVLTLIGEQGAYKSTFFRNLLPPELRRYFYVKTDNTVINKDDRLQMTCNWLICLEEIDSLSRKEQNQLKAMITLETVQDRPAYARHFEVRRRICSFCATGNNEHFLNDPTGSRRWLPFVVESIDDPNRFDYRHEALFYQAYNLSMDVNFRHYLTRQETNNLNERNRNFEDTDKELELIQHYFAVPKPGEQGVYLTTTEILLKINSGLRESLSTNKVGMALKKLGFTSKHSRTGTKYHVIELTYNDMEARKREI